MPSARTGKLSIFLGYAPGVGKTSAMISAARLRRAQGVDVVAACLDVCPADFAPGSLARPESNQIETQLGAFDLDALLARRPDLALVDRLAATNPPGCRHTRRWQDVEEILQRGIDVFTTLNVSEVASLYDQVSQILPMEGAAQVPDGLLRQAEVILVDRPARDLLQQYSFKSREGAPDLRQLTALRGLALRLAGEQAPNQPHPLPDGQAAYESTPGSYRLMVCVSSHPISERLIRTGCRMARELNADWIVVYVETPDRLHYPSSHADRLAHFLQLAEDLGARVVSVSGREVPETLIDYARSHQVSHLIVGKPLRPRLAEILSGSVVDQIIRRSGPIGVYVINDESGPLGNALSGWIPHRPWGRYLAAIALVLAVSILNIPIHLFIEPTNLVMLYLLAVIISALYLGRGPSLLASVLSVVTFDYFFVDPRLSFSVEDTQYLLTFLGLFGTGLAVSSLAGLVRKQVETAQSREARTARLYNFSRELTVCADLNAVLSTVLKHLEQTFECKAALLLPGDTGLRAGAASPDLELSGLENEAARWAFQHSRPAGWESNTLAETALRWQPLQTARGVVGVVGVQMAETHHSISNEQLQLLDAYASLAALAVERAALAEQANRTRLFQEAEKLQTALLNSISHDLRTPLASVTGVFSSLYETETGTAGVVMDHETRLDLISTGWEEADRLNRLVGNLLDMSRLEAGAVHLNLEDGDIEDLIGSALQRMHTRLQNFSVRTCISADRPLVKIDFVLLEQVLTNLLDNAAKYSLPGEEIEVGAKPETGSMELWVADRGNGIPEGELERIFEKFYRADRQDGIRGTGLGLSICKAIVEAHNGKIWAANRPGGGACIFIRIPLLQDAHRTLSLEN